MEKQELELYSRQVTDSTAPCQSPSLVQGPGQAVNLPAEEQDPPHDLTNHLRQHRPAFAVHFCLKELWWDWI
jgi:hypothetical protein